MGAHHSSTGHKAALTAVDKVRRTSCLCSVQASSALSVGIKRVLTCPGIGLLAKISIRESVNFICTDVPMKIYLRLKNAKNVIAT